MTTPPGHRQPSRREGELSVVQDCPLNCHCPHEFGCAYLKKDITGELASLWKVP